MRPSGPVCDRPFRLLCDPKLRFLWHDARERVCPYCKAALRVTKPSRWRESPSDCRYGVGNGRMAPR